jgi:sulfoxide reductase heme-binding subunit YedZ
MDIIDNATPWFWYFTRASGLLAFICLWIAVFLGLAIRNPLLKKFVNPIYNFDFHCFISALATFWGLAHGTSILLDKNFPFTVGEVFIPFFSHSTLVDPTYLGLGIIAFYAMLLVTITSYLKKNINHMFWRTTHFLGFVAFLFIVMHGLRNGTDFKDGYLPFIYLGLSVIIMIVYVMNILIMIDTASKNKINNPPRKNSEDTGS